MPYPSYLPYVLTRSRRPNPSSTETDIKALTINEQPDLIDELEPAFQTYNEDQFVTVKLPGSSQQVIISEFSALGDGRYFDVESSSSFAFDHTSQKASGVQSYALEGAQAELV